MNSKTSEYLKSIEQDCLRCGLCERIQSKSGQRPLAFGSIANMLLDAQSACDEKDRCLEVSDIPSDAYDFVRCCMMCNRCIASCPAGIKASDFVSIVRGLLIELDPSIADAYRNYRCDKATSMFTRIKQIWGTSYEEALPCDLNDAKPCGESMFIPGCSLGNNFPGLAFAVYQELIDIGEADCLSLQCCGLPLILIGLAEEFESYARKLCSRIEASGVKRIITACPNCYSMLPEVLELGGISHCVQVIALPRLLADRGYKYEPGEDGVTCISIHDSCPDRFDGTFADSIREMFSNIDVAELEHSRENSACCGSGGFASVYDPKLAQVAFSEKSKECLAAGAQGIVASCATCSAALKTPGYFPNAYHYLELVLGVEMDMDGYAYVMNALWNSTGDDSPEAIFADMSELFTGDTE